MDYRIGHSRKSPWGERIERCPKCGQRGVVKRDWIAGPLTPRWINGEQGPRVRTWTWLEECQHHVEPILGGLGRAIRAHCHIASRKVYTAPQSKRPNA